MVMGVSGIKVGVSDRQPHASRQSRRHPGKARSLIARQENVFRISAFTPVAGQRSTNGHLKESGSAGLDMSRREVYGNCCGLRAVRHGSAAYGLSGPARLPLSVGASEPPSVTPRTFPRFTRVGGEDGLRLLAFPLRPAHGPASGRREGRSIIIDPGEGAWVNYKTYPATIHT